LRVGVDGLLRAGGVLLGWLIATLLQGCSWSDQVVAGPAGR
jgi:hypothetical protein